MTDHTSVLKLIQWRWQLPPLTARDASTDVRNLADVLNLSRPMFDVPNLPRPAAPLPQPCPSVTGPLSPGAGTDSVWLQMLRSGVFAGWPIEI